MNHGISLRDVDFSYSGKSVFRGLNIDFPARTLTAVVGPSGIGKSTLLDLLCGLSEPDRGAVLVDGVPLTELDLRAWRRMLGYVPQEMILLHDTVMHNVIAGEAELTATDGERALRQAGAWEFVSELVDGPQTVIGERGGRLSGGQRQRIMIARALAHHPAVLLLDEPTSARDRDTERKIFSSLKELSRTMTVIVVSHQTSLTETADQVIHVSTAGVDSRHASTDMQRDAAQPGN